jgi:hypothetical protein
MSINNYSPNLVTQNLISIKETHTFVFNDYTQSI